MLTMTNDYTGSQVFFGNLKNNLLQNFSRHLSKTDRPVITKAFPLSLLENWDNICQLPVDKDLSRLPRLLKNNGERSLYNISQLFHYPGMNPLSPIDLCAFSWSSKS